MTRSDNFKHTVDHVMSSVLPVNTRAIRAVALMFPDVLWQGTWALIYQHLKWWFAVLLQ